MSKLKFMYESSLPKEVEEELEEKVTNEDGSETITKKKVKKQKDFLIKLRKPTRSLIEEGDLFYTVQISKLVQAGVLTRAMLQKRIVNDDGLLSDTDKKKLIDLYEQFVEIQTEISKLNVKEALSDEEKARADFLRDKISKTRDEIQEIESVYSSVFDHTAEVKSRNKTITWWVLNLAYVQDVNEQEPKPLFKGNTFEEKMEAYEAIDEEDDTFLFDVVQKFAYFVTAWYNGYASKQEQFEEFAKGI